MNHSLLSSATTAASTALVLAGAGAAGNAWQIGVVAGLLEGGVDLTRADVVIGTSAGSTTAAQITSGVPLTELLAAILTPSPAAQGSGRSRPAHLAGPASVDWSEQIIAASTDAADWRRRMCAAARERDVPAHPNRWRDIVAARLARHEWPEQRVLITAVDARTAEPVVFDRQSGIELVDAVAASTSNGFGGTYPIGDDRYINGAYRRSSNADLATGCQRVVVLDPFAGRSRTPGEWGMDLTTQVAELRDGGSEVEIVHPDSRSGDVFTANALDPATRLPAARGGYAQGRSLAPHLAGFWP
ncbi:patatin-like phospholipase family protein [Microbacterium rhizomatis]|uniref:Patatin-like phospholipase family protein n=1 Tax=Microbacterium rhizomatis TaxID=1631477 RepID=A0A5J5J6K5_9MICO|nr:patatin-like phospholipase family protein [Microbacterium rhizomatis]KAA9110605.1 patatin-like phospholipase family protein [Microbacterium rhizomatis]